MNFRLTSPHAALAGLLAAALASQLGASTTTTGAATATVTPVRAAGVPETAATSQAGIGSEDNFWPAVVRRLPADGSERSQLLGPLAFATDLANGDHISGVRPLFLHREWPGRKMSETDILYPFFVYRGAGDRWTWSVLGLVNRHSPRGPAIGTDTGGFDLWPFYFSRRHPDPEKSYRAVFPLFGPLKNRLFNDRIDWVLFPFYARYQKDERVTVTAPWPFFRTTHGGGHSGWALWPLYGQRAQEGVFRNRTWLWPLAYHNVSGLDEKAGPTVRRGLLPFYTEDLGPGLDRRTYLWPFFGTTHDTLPKRYDETRYFWPLLLQGRGEEAYRNRWAPFYSHSRVKDVSKTWILWPLWRDQSFRESKLDQRKRQFLFFVYWDLEQRLPGSPAGGPVASKTHLWPLWSAWDNGAGRRQFQLLSPLEPLFQHNETARHAWSPLFSLYRSEKRGDDYSRRSALWEAVSYERSRSTASSRFKLGPLLSNEASAGGRRVSLLCGLVGLRREAGASWKPFLFDFKSRKSVVAAAPGTAPSAAVQAIQPERLAAATATSSASPALRRAPLSPPTRPTRAASQP